MPDEADTRQPPDIVLDKALLDQAASNLQSLLRDQAPSEALVRALVAERNQDRKMARFWVSVFEKTCS